MVVKKKVLIKAYTALNLGDDLFIKLLSERYPHIDFYLFTYENYNNFETLKNLKILKYTLLQKILNKIFRITKVSPNFIQNTFSSKVDAIIEIGGSIFIENKSYETSLEERKKQLFKVNNNYFILGANFGPYTTNEYKIKYENFFSKCKDICFREKYSYDLFNGLENIRLAKDIVFGLGIKKSTSKEYILYSVIKPSFRDELKNKDAEYYKNIANSTIELIKKGKKIKYMSFCKKEGDEEAIKNIIEELPFEYRHHVSIYCYSGNIKEALSIINGAEFIVATRFHAMILGFICEKKVLPIAYSKKIVNVLKDLNFKEKYVEFDSLNEIEESLILKSGSLALEELKKAKKESYEHFKKLDIYLEG